MWANLSQLLEKLCPGVECWVRESEDRLQQQGARRRTIWYRLPLVAWRERRLDFLLVMGAFLMQVIVLAIVLFVAGSTYRSIDKSFSAADGRPECAQTANNALQLTFDPAARALPRAAVCVKCS